MRLTRQTMLIFTGILLAMAFIVWISPEERTLGTRIKIVYVHVSFVWTGLLGFTLTGLLGGLALVCHKNKWLVKHLPLINLTSLLFFLMGFVLSIAAAKINWGGILWREPRAIGALNIIAIALVVQVLSRWTANIRLRAALYIGQWLFIIYTQASIKNAIHPENPIFSSDSASFAITVLSLTGLVILLAAWAVYVQAGQPGKRAEQSARV